MCLSQRAVSLFGKKSSDKVRVCDWLTDGLRRFGRLVVFVCTLFGCCYKAALCDKCVVPRDKKRASYSDDLFQ